MQSVNQVSLPMRIALVATLAFSAIWFVALRPKPVPTEPAATPPVAGAESAPGQAAATAQEAVGASQQSADAHEAAAGGTAPAGTATPASPATSAQQQAAGKPTPAVDVKQAAADDVPEETLSVLRDVSRGKVAVLLFWDSRLSDDRAVHTAVKGLSRRGGKVAVHIAPVAKLARYESITRGVPVVTSPTVLIIDRAGRARTVAGLSVPRELEELVGKALKVKP